MADAYENKSDGGGHGDLTGYHTELCTAFGGATATQVCLSASGANGVFPVHVEEEHIVEGPQLRQAMSMFAARVLQVGLAGVRVRDSCVFLSTHTSTSSSRC